MIPPGASHVFNNGRWIARDMLGEVAGDHPGVEIERTAGRIADDETNSLIFVEILRVQYRRAVGSPNRRNDEPLTNVLKTACISTSTIADLSATDKRNGLSFRSLQISHECVFVLREIGIRTGNFPVHETFFDFANEKSQFALLQRP